MTSHRGARAHSAAGRGIKAPFSSGGRLIDRNNVRAEIKKRKK